MAGSNRERDIRRRFIEQDLVETVVLLPENLFYNTPSPAILLVINRAKRHPGETLLINASRQFEKGRPKNRLGAMHVELLARVHAELAADESLSAIVATPEAIRNDFNLSPSRYVAVDDAQELMPLEDAVVLLREVEEERSEADAALRETLAGLGFQA